MEGLLFPRDKAPDSPNGKGKLRAFDREREFFRYYQPTRSVTPIIPPYAQPPYTLEPPSDPTYDDSLEHLQQFSQDPTLIAFAQLGTLRLNGGRALITFFSRRLSYVLAEATPTLSLETATSLNPHHQLCWGSQVTEKGLWVCETTATLAPIFAPEDPTLPGTGPREVSALIIPDLAEDERFKNKPYVTGPPWARFYAGVPIRTPAGSGIGAFCVLDGVPRPEGVTDEQLTFLKDMAVAIMRHLELVKSEDFSQHMGRMVRGLGKFIEDPGRSSTNERDFTRTGSRVPWGDDSLPQGAESSLPIGPGSNGEELPSPALSVESSVASPGVTPTEQGLNATDDGSRYPGSTSNIPRESRTPASSKHSSGDPSENVKSIFTRAAGILKDATGADGLMFYDANITTFGGLVEDSEEVYIRDGLAVTRTKTFTTKGEDKPCGVLGYLVNDLSGGIAPSACMAEKLLGSLLQRYPHGKIFEFGATPQNTPVSDVPEPLSRTDLDLVTLSRLIPKAKSLVLLPLYAFDRTKIEHPFAAALLWTCDRERVFREGEVLAYLKAFGNSMMAELARVDAKRADRAKADFISGVTHELRSPLHGILGCVELMLDDHASPESTRLSIWHREMATTIETCSRTLLDTVNHVLDFAKINYVKRHSSPGFSIEGDPYNRPRGPMTEAGKDDGYSAQKDVDLAALAEEVVETAYAGYRFPNRLSISSTPEDTRRKGSDEPSSQDRPESGLEGLVDNLNSSFASPTNIHHRNEPGSPADMVSKVKPVLVLVDICKTGSWTFKTQPGAWRRILMNLFGNSLKYTDSGYVCVRLECRALPALATSVAKSSQIPERCEVVLKVIDSGHGMSSTYLRDHLFHPFAQEDPLTPGTGLGLSITRQIVSSMDGRIDVRSEKGRGTQMTVTVELERVDEPSLLSLSINAPSTTLSGKTISFFGFSEQALDAEHTKQDESLNGLLESTLRAMCTAWCGMQVLPPGSKSDMYVVYEEAIDQTPATISAPLLIIGATRVSSTDRGSLISVPQSHRISLPCGPKKFAAALRACLEVVATGNSTNALDNGSSLPATEGGLEMPSSHSKTVNPTTTSTQPVPVSSADGTFKPLAPPLKRGEAESRSNAINDAAAPDQASNAGLLEDNPTQLNVLLVDDNAVNLRLLNAYMKRKHHLYTMASNGLEALNAFKQSISPFDLILMDISMPVMDGLEATRAIRAHEIETNRLRHEDYVPGKLSDRAMIVALTGLSNQDVRQEAFSSGVDKFMTKPVSMKQLSTILDTVKVDRQPRMEEK